MCLIMKRSFFQLVINTFYCFQCGRNDLVLQQTLTLVERAQSLAPNSAEFQTEVSTCTCE